MACPEWARGDDLNNPLPPEHQSTRMKFNWPATIAYLREVTSRLILTLSEHILHLYGSTHLVCGQFWSDPPNFYVFENVGDVKDSDESDLRNQHLVTAQAPQSGSP